jgi:HPt (histidine-containing phosphotransfer) domain-containing protein
VTALTPKLLAELERLEKEGTPGPWRAYGQWVAEVTAHAVGDPEAPDTRILSGNEFDCDLTAAVRNALPALLAAARELHALKSALEFLGKHRLNILAMPAERAIKLARQLGWVDPFTTGDKS